MLRLDAKDGHYQTVSPDSRSYAISLTTGVSYADLPPGDYQGWLEGTTAGSKLRLAYLVRPASGTPTAAAADLPGPTATANTQAAPFSSYPATASTGSSIAGDGEVPGDAGTQVQIYISSAHRLALTLSAGTGTLRLTKVL